MIVIVDANVIISGIIQPFGIIPKLLLQQNRAIDFVLPGYALEEIFYHQKKICKAAGVSATEFSTLVNKLLANVLLYSTDSIDNNAFTKAIKLVKGIDEKDAVYIGFSLAFDALFWTGDLKLYRGLRRKGFRNIIITKELTDIIKGLK